MGNLYRRHSIDVSYQVADHLAKQIRRRLKCLKLTDDRRWTPSDGESLHGLSWPGEQISTKGHIMIYKTLHYKLKIELHEHLHNTYRTPTDLRNFFFFVINSFITKGENHIHN